MGRFYAEIYGCSLNRGEAEDIIERLIEKGHEAVSDPIEAELSMLFTCTVIDTTERRMRKRLGSLPSPLIVSGCMASAQADTVLSLRPDALLFGPEESTNLIPEALDILKRGGASHGPVDHAKMTREREIRRYPIGDNAQIIPIASGCTGCCSYCITRIARPDLRSKPPDQIYPSVMDSSAPEVRLSAQDASVYGLDLGTDIAELIDGLPQEGPMVRIGMMNPRTLLPILETVVEAYGHPHLFKFLHLPLQSGSDRLLASMERGYRATDVEMIINRFRTEFPGIRIASDAIAGFPGETEEDHLATLELIQRLDLDVLNVTRFSPRPGTPAFDLEAPHSRLAKERSRSLTELQEGISRRKLSERIGSMVNAMPTEPGRDHTVMCRDMNYTPIVIKDELDLGTWCEFEIVGSTTSYLIGERII